MQSEEIDTKKKINKEIEAEKKHELIEEPKDRLSVGENEKETKKELINRENLKEIPIIEKELNIEKKEKSSDPEDSSTSEDSESDYERCLRQMLQSRKILQRLKSRSLSTI